MGDLGNLREANKKANEEMKPFETGKFKSILCGSEFKKSSKGDDMLELEFKFKEGPNRKKKCKVYFMMEGKAKFKFYKDFLNHLQIWDPKALAGEKITTSHIEDVLENLEEGNARAMIEVSMRKPKKGESDEETAKFRNVEVIEVFPCLNKEEDEGGDDEEEKAAAKAKKDKAAKAKSKKDAEEKAKAEKDSEAENKGADEPTEESDDKDSDNDSDDGDEEEGW